MERYFLGIDGGGTKTAFTLIDSNRNTVYEATAGPSGLDNISLDELKSLFEREIGKIPYPISAVFAGIGGIVCEGNCEDVNRVLASVPALKSARIDSANDVMSALYGGLDGKDGILLIAGTGSVAFGKYKGKTHRCGGYSYKEGDPGSAYWLGQRALSFYAGVLDGRWETDALSERIALDTGCTDYASLAKFFAESDRTSVAALAPAVTSTADTPSSTRILLDGIEALAELIGGVYRSLAIDEPCDFCVIGSLGNAQPYRSLLKERIAGRFPLLSPVPVCHSPSFGAALRAMELSDI